ncbi:thioredoxin 1 [Clostridium saccharoperbutylacetonicum]|jgi:thioredoxin 1|uniref:Thioredoxin n=1 Tax=Clostridium saccharoperbutylacetonicum N1-4(HMT) TaxID=931276 RepID=M1MP56_9CLOT|nr:thioredoxin [Clostridium saccharoperbutylacetonicum]AGF58003.1 thioredoxin TrxA [Clostridium saccharoperbutylacetonicum N1-4(HMT)]NRT61224.1 thioredoxin 1 [Clostridium saccharoperbutylacetonicum]NSB24541.1 thioredoxin 1 [Clostridium saccharoperbutylacetonicum]NSB43916.1 thioredoxin 1 [Clostridium saccharoperbutylacetonicum]
MAKIIDSNEFFENVENTEGVVVVDFFANWCGPCKMLAPVFEGVSNEMGDKAKFFKLDIDEGGRIAQKYGISAVPTMIIFKDGVPVENLTGFMPKENITNKVRAHL